MTLIAPATKVCTRCSIAKPPSEFHRHPQTTDGLQPRCKVCACEAARVSYRADPERGKANAKRWRAANLDKSRRYVHGSRLRHNFNLTIEDYDRMLAAQQGRCAICGSAEPGRRSKFFCMDHDHETGRVRGLLCMDCNDGLGRFRDSVRLFGRAIAYLGGDF